MMTPYTESLTEKTSISTNKIAEYKTAIQTSVKFLNSN